MLSTFMPEIIPARQSASVPRPEQVVPTEASDMDVNWLHHMAHTESVPDVSLDQFDAYAPDPVVPDATALAAAATAHDLGNFLMAARGNAEFISLDGDLTEEQKSSLQSTLHAIKLSIRTASGLSDLAALESGKSCLQQQKVDLKELFHFCLCTVSALPVAKGKIIEHDTGAVGTIVGDRAKLLRILCNLLQNECKYSDIGGHVFLAARMEDNHVVITVRDEGKGIPLADQQEIFDPYTQAENHVQGTGLGLYISKKFAEMHGGSISVQSTEGAGSTFSVVLPIQGADSETD